MCSNRVNASTLVDLLLQRSHHHPDHPAYTYLPDGEKEELSLTYGELDLQARAIGALLQGLVARGERALLLYPPGLDFICGFFGCLYAGVIAVPAYPPDAGKLTRALPRLQSVVADAQASLVLTTKTIALMAKDSFAQKGLRWVATDVADFDLNSQWRKPSLDANSLAFLQYTSGSTGAAKGVMLTHGNLLHNAAAVYDAVEHKPGDKYVSWLPTFHDMGFMAGVLQPLYAEIPAVLLSPISFLERPFRWLAAISRYKATTSGGPNFAYDLCVRKVSPQERATLDLSSWTVAFNGAETVRAETLERFTSAFEGCGFRRETFYPCYGLAEATLIVSGGSKTATPVYLAIQSGGLKKAEVVKSSASSHDEQLLVSCGRSLPDQKVIIVNPDRLTECRHREVGEIWVSGPSVAQGYWNQPDQTERTFMARLSDKGGGPFLRTGDLGFLKRGELFVTGRLKDLIIIRGLNHYPQDIEATVVGTHVALRPGCGAAFSVDTDGEERLVVVQEVDQRLASDLPELIGGIRQAIADEHQLQAYAVALIKPGSIPKTSSGKIQRHACRAKFLGAIPEVVAEWREGKSRPDDRSDEALNPATLNKEQIREWLALFLARELGLRSDEIDLAQPLTRYGLDSLMAVEIAHSLDAEFKITLSVADVLKPRPIAELASQIATAITDPAASIAPAKAVSGRQRETDYPLSKGQLALWFLQQFDPASSAYNIAHAVGITGKLDIPALKQALQFSLNRHSLLRATFPDVNGKPVVRVHDDMENYFHEVDASSWADERLKAQILDEANEPFNLQQGPLLRLILFTGSAQAHTLLLVMHHIVADLWSLAVLMSELNAIYAAESAGLKALLPPLAVQYSDYVRRQAEMLDGPEGDRLYSYWHRQLSGELPALGLPTDRPRPPVQSYKGSCEFIKLDRGLTEAIKLLAQDQHATLFMTLLAAFKALLYRYSGQTDIIVGSPTTGRNSADLAGLFGYFVNPIAIRAQVSGGMTFDELLRQVRQTVLEAFENQDYPFASLVEKLQPVRHPSRSPIFQVMFAFQKAPLLNEEGFSSFALGQAEAHIKMGDLLLEPIAIEQQTSQFDLTLSLAEVNHELAAALEYNTEIFDAVTIKRMMGHFQTLSASIVAAPGARLSELEILPEAERRRLISEWAHARQGPPDNDCIHNLFEERAERHPDVIAVISEKEQVNYGELNRRANQLARRLVSAGVGPEVLVCICMPRSIEMIVSLLAVLKAGGAYVPLDHSYPGERLASMLEDSHGLLLLTQSDVLERLPDPKMKVMCLDTDWAVVAREGVENLDVGVTPLNLALVIYTSGSTGKPKGVMIQHQSLVSYVRPACLEYKIGPDDRFLQFVSFSFDASAEDIFTCLSGGGALVLRDEVMVSSPSAFIQTCRDLKLTVLDLPTAYWHELVVNLSAEDWSSAERLRLLIIGGEKAIADRLETWRRCVGSRIQLINVYGPTETTIASTHCDLAQVGPQVRDVPIGCPVTNVHLYVLDDYTHPVPIGVPGEIHIGGINVARGYLNHPELTAEKFIPNPFADERASRLYKTGDLGRYLTDGTLEFLGRADQQVKIRGFRIELGEIEAALVQHSAISDAVVIAREDDPGAKRLAAYLVAESDNPPVTAELRSFLKERLPEYMVPAAFVFLTALPMTPGGKVDKRSLPIPQLTRLNLESEFATPRTVIEREMAVIWAEVLRVDSVGINDNFFELGGDSILSIQVTSRSKQAGIRVTPKQLFEYPTISGIAAVAVIDKPYEVRQELVVGEVMLTPPQCWFIEQAFSAPHHWNMSVLLEARRRLSIPALEKVIQHLFEHHDGLRTRFAIGEPGWRQFVAAPDAGPLLHSADLSNLSEAEQGTAVRTLEAEIQGSLNLAEGPLARFVLFKFGARKPDRVLIAIHHLIVDAVSMRILLDDLGHGYRQLQNTGSIKPSPKTTSYKRYSELLCEGARRAATREKSSYWLTEHSDLFRGLPLDHQARDGGANTEASSRTVSVSLDAEETRSLLQDVPGAYRTQINDVLLTALVESFSGWTGSRALLVELEGHGREEIVEGVDLSRTLGWFTTFFPVRLDIGRCPTAVDALKCVKEQLRLVPGGGIDYGLLRYMNEDDAIRESMRRLPRPDVSFNYLGQLDHAFTDSSPLVLVNGFNGFSGTTRSAEEKRSCLIDVSARVSDGRLCIDWTYSEHLHERTTIERVAQSFARALRSLINQCLSAGAGGYTPSDFPMADLDQQKLDELLSGDGQIEELYSLSPMQEGMLFHSLYARESGVYIGQLSFTLRGCLDVGAFEAAWQRVLERHAVLRTDFAWEGLDRPLQIVRGDVRLPLRRLDLSALPQPERRQKVASFLGADRHEEFALTAAPLMRLALIMLDEDSYQFVWSHHQILLDGWCLALILSDLFAYYEAIRQGHDLKLERVRPYREYISWLREQDLSKAEPFWREALKGFTAPTPLVIDRIVSAPAADEDYGSRRLQLSAEATSALQSFAQRNHVTSNTLAQGAWALLLNRYCGEKDVLFGATSSGRSAALPDVDRMVGVFINTLPIRVAVDSGASLTAWLKDLQVQQAALRQYEYCPLVQIQGWSDIAPGQPLFESVVVFENYPVSSFLDQRLSLELGDFASYEKTNYPLTLLVIPGPRLELELLYDRNRIDDPTAERMLKHLNGLLEGFIAAPGSKLLDLPMLTESEARQLLFEWNDTSAEPVDDSCIHHLFESQVSASPDNVALTFGAVGVTYSELNRRANLLAHHLIFLGVGPEELVGICCDRSVEMVVAMLAVLKAGGAYLPLDPHYPQGRLRFMLEDAGAKVLLTQHHLIGAIPAGRSQVISLDADWEHIKRHGTDNPDASVNSSNLAYVIYTSGSTGMPKGVAIEHRSAVILLNWAKTVFSEGDLSGILASTSICFDLSVFELFAALCLGGKAVLVENALRLPDSSAAGQVRLINTVPSVMSELLRAGGVPTSARTINLAGEPLQNALALQLFEQSGVERIFNLYGPTEDTTYSTFALVDAAAKGNPSIGRPIARTQVYILDAYLRPAPVGVPGELYISGEGLARGYLNSQGLTAEKFIPSPFAKVAGARLYRTGDVARRLPDGSIDYIGRVDHQVKVHGFRIELGEIEAALLEHPAVEQAVVIAREDATNDRRLVAYVVARQSQRLSDSQLQASLKEKLPQHLIPHSFVMLESLPLTPNGKVDRRALPAPRSALTDFDKPHISQLTPVEEIVTGIWAEVLGLGRVNVDDNFFEVGGHSLLAGRIVSRVRNIFGIDLPLRTIFEEPTVAALAKSIEAARSTTAEIARPQILPTDRSADLPLSFAQQRLWFLDQWQPGNPFYNIAATAELTGRPDIAALERAFSEIVRRHESLRTCFPAVGGQAVQVILKPAPVTLPLVDLQTVPESEQEVNLRQLISERARSPFDLARGPLLRIDLARLRPDRHVLILVAHHIIIDEWSLGLLIRELITLYEAFNSGLQSPLSDLPIQYADYAHWQRQRLRGEVLREQLSYWERLLDGRPAVLDLPLDRPRPAMQQYNGASLPSLIPGHLLAPLKALTRREGSTLFMALLTSFNVLLSRYAGQDDIVIGTVIANRSPGDVEELIGYFTNTLPVRTDLSGNPTFPDLLRRVREVVLSAYTHSELPLEKLIEEIQPERDLSHSPLFQVMFVLEDNLQEKPNLLGLALSQEGVDTGTSKFDLSLYMKETSAGLKATFEYNTDLFDPETIGRMAVHLRTLLEGIAVGPLQHISDLPILTGEERRQLLSDFNSTPKQLLKTAPIHQLFEDQVRRRPNDIAVVFGSRQFTYRELNSRANQLASHLKRSGVGPEVLVGVCVERSPEMLIALLAVLKSGGAYVPLDPAHPKHRLAFIVEDSEASVLITQRWLFEEGQGTAEHVIYLDGDWLTISARDEQDTCSGVTWDNLAYVIYTSGSTGKPKGVQIPHRAVANFLSSMLEEPGLCENDRLLAVTTFSFDIAVLELFLPLVVGARLEIVASEEAADGPALIEKLSTSGATVMQATPSTWRLLLERGWRGSRHMKLLCGGEALSPDLAGFLSAASDNVWNMYGPTETTVWSAVCRLHSEDATAPIGLPIANTRIHIVDRSLNLAPVGAAGDLVIGGEGLARGYLRRPDLTAEKFIPDPYSEEPGARLYLTGDKGRRLPSGKIEYLGRADAQVKVRGYRIELGEIEAVLVEHPDVKEAVVVCEEEGDKSLVAYLVAERKQGCEAGELRSFLKERLPQYMVPAFYTTLETLPLTPNGKIDRRALAASQAAGVKMKGAYAPPRNVEEQTVAEILADVLGLPRVGIHDNFFDLGGHSLLASRAIARVSDAFQLDIPIRSLFIAPTVAELVSAIIEKETEQADPDVLVEALAELKQLTDEDARLELSSESGKRQRWTNE